MPSARPDRLAVLALLLLASAALAGPAPPPPPPALDLPASAPVITASIGDWPVRLTVDFGGDPFVVLAPAAVARLGLAAPGRVTTRGLVRVAVG